MRIRINVNLPEPTRTAYLAAKLRDKTELNKRLSGDLVSIVQGNFAIQGDPKWPLLAKTTIKDRTRKGYWPGLMLQRSGMLLRSYHGFFDGNEAGAGSNLAYAAIQNNGGTIIFHARQEIFSRKRATDEDSWNGGKYKEGQFKKMYGKRKPGRGFYFGEHSIVIPARPVLTVNDTGMQTLSNTIIDYLTH